MSVYRQYCPVARAAEILADRWTLLIVRELLTGSRHFNHIERGLPGISRSLLSARLRTLEDGGVIERRSGQRPHATAYELTDAGHALRPVVETLAGWGARWAFGHPRPEELDPALLLWKIHRRVRRDALPDRRVVVEFEMDGPRRRRFWLLLGRGEVSLCLKPPGFASDLVARADVRTLYAFWLGEKTLAEAIRSGTLRIDGPPALARQFPRWLQPSALAPTVRQGLRAATSHPPGERARAARP